MCLKALARVQLGHEGAHPLLFNEGNCWIERSIDAAVEVWIDVIIDTVPGRP